jgi:hypothetical protein
LPQIVGGWVQTAAAAAAAVFLLLLRTGAVMNEVVNSLTGGSNLTGRF